MLRHRNNTNLLAACLAFLVSAVSAMQLETQVEATGEASTFLRAFGGADWTCGALIVFICVGGMVYPAGVYLAYLRNIQINGKFQTEEEKAVHSKMLGESPEEDPESLLSDPREICDNMMKIADAISEGAEAFMRKEFEVLAIFIVLAGAFLAIAVHFLSCIAFVFGAVTSAFCGYIGMRIAVYTNVRTCHQSWMSLGDGFNCALFGGSVMGFSLVSIGIFAFGLTMYITDLILKAGVSKPDDFTLATAMCGFGLGASTVALFARVGGGIYTKAADVGADLSGKNEYGMDEDDPRNPACIADNVGDNVGDIAGMGADLFGSFAEATCAALYIWSKDVTVASSSHIGRDHWSAMLYPLMLSASGIVSGLITMLVARWLPKIVEEREVETRLKVLLFASTVLQTGMSFLIGHMFLPPDFTIANVGDRGDLAITGCVVIGLWAGAFIGLITEYYTSHSYAPVRETAESYRTSASTGLILGYALGFKSTVLPLLLIAATITATMKLAGYFGIAMAAIGMLSTLTVSLSIDAYGPIADNAGGIAEMAGLGREVRRRTDCLDAAGNTTAAIGKGFAIGSAALVGTALFNAFVVSVFSHNEQLILTNTFVLLGLFVGAMLPFLFAAWLMTSVAHAAQDMLQECYRQFPLILNEGARPDYSRCVGISTRASLREMIAPAMLVVLAPLLGGICLGSYFVCGLLMGILLSALLLAIAMSNSGGAFDNAKKYIEAGGLGDGIGKGSQAHKNAVVGDTLGDPLKDTSGPALNIFMKLSAVTALTFSPLIANFSEKGEPKWLH